MPYLNNHFHVYDVHKDLSFQIVGKTYFIKFLNEYTSERLVDYGRYRYFTTYNELNKSKCIRVYIDQKKKERV